MPPIPNVYNKEQVNELVLYAKLHKIAHLTLHAYQATVNRVDDEGYTVAHNADVAEMSVTPDELAEGIVALVREHRTDVTISSKVVLADGSRRSEAARSVGHIPMGHIPMLDMAIPFVPYKDPGEAFDKFFPDLDRFLVRTQGLCRGEVSTSWFGPAALYVSGNSYHAYGLNRAPISPNEFTKLIAGMLVVDHDKIADHAWLGFCLARGEFRLRLTAVQAKYKHLPAKQHEVEREGGWCPRTVPVDYFDPKNVPF